MIVKVYTDTGKKKPVILHAKVIRETNGIYQIQYLSQTNDTFDGKPVYKFENEIYDIDDESITEYLDDLHGFTQIDDMYIKDESDVDYCPSECSNDSDSESYSYEKSDDEEGYSDEEYYSDCTV